MTNISFSAQKRNLKAKNPELKATEILHSLIFGGAGLKFLGWGVADKLLLPDGSWKKLGNDGWRFWSVPTEQRQRQWWNPIWDHLKGNYRGVVAINAKDVPFVSVDLDRHDASIPAKSHSLRVLKAGRLVKRNFPELYWPVAELNEKNGSAKLFGFTGKPIPIDRARELGQRVHDFLVENGFGHIEVFPGNCAQVGLPMRIDKTTIISSGILGKCVRKKKIDGKFINFETYSAAAFLGAIRSRSHYDEDMLHRVLKRACANLPDRPAAEKIQFPVRRIAEAQGQPEAIQRPKALGDYTDESNSLTRQLSALLELARRLRRVPSEKESLSFIKENRLYTGDWADNDSRRAGRVRWILRHIAKTFDPAKCISAKDHVHFGKFDNWALNHVGTLREKVRRNVDEYGNILEGRGRTVVDWRFVSVMLSILEFCFDHPTLDRSLSEDSARKIWESSLRSKIIDEPWNGHKWAIVRDWLDEIGVIDVFDRRWHFDNGRGQAMRWRPTDEFYELHSWFKKKRIPSVNDAIPLEEFLKQEQHPPSLNYYENKKTLLAVLRTEGRRSRAPPWTLLAPKAVMRPRTDHY
jgi:hypothetical protein